MSKTSAAAVATGVAVLLAAAGSAQPPPLPGFAASTEVRVVNVEVRAFDHDGRPVTDLRREDFRIFENGREVPISHFFSSAAPRDADPVAAPTPPPAPAPAAAPATPLHVAILVDNVHLGPAHRATALRSVAHFAETSLPPEAQVMLASYDGGLNVWLRFGESRAKLSAALSDMGWLMAAGMQSDRWLRDALETIRWRQQAAIENPFEGPCPRALLDLARAYAEPKQAEVEHAIAALGLLVDALAAVPGRKVVLLVSDGFPMRAGAEVFGYVALLCDGSGARQGLEWAYEVTEPDKVQPGEPALAALGYDAAGELAAVTARANAAEVTLYTLQATGLQTLSSADAASSARLFTTEFDGERRANYQDGLHALAADTGGRAILERNDFQVALDGVGDDLKHFYSLGFSPSPRAAGATSTIRVEVDRPGVHLRYRRRFQLRSPDEEATDRVRGALLLDLAPNPLGLALTAAKAGKPAAATGGPGWRIRLEVPLAPLTCVDEGAGRRCLISVFLGARRADGSLTPVRTKTMPVAWTADPQGQPERVFVYEIGMTADSELQRVAAVVRDEFGGLLSVVAIPVAAEGSP